MDEEQRRFLKLVQVGGWRRSVPKCWLAEYNKAIAAGYVTISFGGLIALTKEGLKAVE